MITRLARSRYILASAPGSLGPRPFPDEERVYAVWGWAGAGGSRALSVCSVCMRVVTFEPVQRSTSTSLAPWKDQEISSLLNDHRKTFSVLSRWSCCCTVYRLPAGAIVCLILYIVECSGNGMCAQFQYPFVHWPCTTGRMCSSLHYIAEHFTRKVEYVI